MTALRLRPYQADLQRSVFHEMQQGARKILAVLPTGGGKTAVFASMAGKAQAKGSRVWFLVHRRELLDQTLETFERFEIPRDRVRIDMVGSVNRRLDELEAPDLIVFDEGHHAVARTWERIAEAYPSTYLIGLTATPARLDGKPLGKIYESLVVGPSTADLIREGYLSRYKIIGDAVSLNLAGVQTTRGDYDLAEVAKRMEGVKVFGDVVASYLNYAKGLQGIYFCPSVEFSEQMAARFRAAGIPAEHFDGKTPKRKRRELVEDFRAGKIRILTNVDLIGEGFDMPACDVVGQLRPTQSLALYLQQCGRSLRPRPGKTAIIIDHVGNFIRHGTPSDPRVWSLHGKVQTGRTLNERGEYLIRICESCFGVYEADTSVCPYCGAAYEFEPFEIWNQQEVRMIEIKQEHIRRRDAFLRSDRALDLAEDYSDLCAIAKARGYKVAWARFKAKERGMWTPW